MNVFKSMNSHYHEVRHTKLGLDAFAESFFLAQITCNMHMERQRELNGNGKTGKGQDQGDGWQHGMEE